MEKKDLIPVTYLGKVIGEMDVITKKIVFDDVNFYNDLLKTNNIVGISSRAIGEIKDNKIVNDYPIEASIITVTKIK